MTTSSRGSELSQSSPITIDQTKRGTIYVGSTHNGYLSDYSDDSYDRGRQKSWKTLRSLSTGKQPVTVNYLTFDGRDRRDESLPILSTEEPEYHQWIIEPVETGFLRLVQNFDFKWYGSTMGTGIVAILLFTFSNIYTDASPVLFHLSVIFYIANLALFSLIFIMTLLRYILYPRLFVMMISDPGQAMYLGTFPMGFATIISMTVNIMVPRFGGPWTEVVLVFWWIDVVVSMATALGVPWLLQVRHHGITDLEKMTAGWLLPIVAPIVAAATGAVVASVLDPDRALITILTSYAILGTGLPTALSIIIIYFMRVATKKLPPTEHMVSTFLPLGPLGQGGFAAQKLGEQALRVFSATNTLPAVGEHGKLLAGEILYTMGFGTAIILWGFGLIWLFFAVLSVTRQKVPFSQGWWAFTFPLGVFAMSTLTMGINLPSKHSRHWARCLEWQ